MNRTYSMAVKVALVGLAAAGAAQAQTLNSGIDGTPGDLYLIVYNSTAKTTYVEDLGLSVTNLFSGAQVTSAVSGGTAGVVSTSSSLPAFNDTEALDSTLSTALASGSTFQWELVAVNASGSQAGAPNYALTTSNGAVSSPFTNSILQNTGVNSMALGMGNDIDTWALNETFTLNGIRTNSSFTGFDNDSDLPGQSGDAGAIDWYNDSGINPLNTTTGSGGTTPKTSAANLYLAVNNGGAGAGVADLFKLGTATLNLTASGTGDTLVFAAASSAVPIPAGLWLFGSGLMGLLGIARRRLAA